MGSYVTVQNYFVYWSMERGDCGGLQQPCGEKDTQETVEKSRSYLQKGVAPEYQARGAHAPGEDHCCDELPLQVNDGVAAAYKEENHAAQGSHAGGMSADLPPAVHNGEDHKREGTPDHKQGEPLGRMHHVVVYPCAEVTEYADEVWPPALGALVEHGVFYGSEMREQEYAYDRHNAGGHESHRNYYQFRFLGAVAQV